MTHQVFGALIRRVGAANRPCDLRPVAWAVVLGAISMLGQSQVAPVVLKIDLDNVVGYWGDGVDFSKLASDSGITTPIVQRTFETQVQIADIVAVNGQPMKGTFLMNARHLGVTTALTPGKSIADTTRNGIAQWTFEFLQPDGTAVGTIFVSALNNGPPPLGAPSVARQSNGVIAGGTGAFWGARGQATSALPTVAPRFASMSEDTASRRINGGGKIQYLLQLIPEERPQVISTANGPAILHASTNQIVTSANPAHGGETLVLFATGLGPVRPGVDIGQPFPASPLALVNSPVEVTVNGVATSVFYAGGYPGAVDGYQVNFTLPPGVASGMASLQLVAAWIPGAKVKLLIQ